MTLSFSTKINGKPNYFPEKIWRGLEKEKICSHSSYWKYINAHIDRFGQSWDDTAFLNPKLHTMRYDPHDRWKPGMDIHMVINNRTKNRFQFAPVLKCVSIQKIEIYPFKNGLGRVVIVENNRFVRDFMPFNGAGLEELTQLAINDGFDSVEDFFAYFNTDFKGKLIHWTDLKY